MEADEKNKDHTKSTKTEVREPNEDIIKGAGNADQLEKLNPGNNPERKNKGNEVGTPPDTEVNDGSIEDT